MSRYISAANCKGKVSNRFELVLLAAQRAKQLDNGCSSLVDKDNHKNTIVSLNEIMTDKITEKNVDSLVNNLSNDLIENLNN